MLNKISNSLGIRIQDSLTLKYIRNVRIHSFLFCFVLLINIVNGNVGPDKTKVPVVHFMYICSVLNSFIHVMKVSC